MSWTTVDSVRKTFIDFFVENKEHTFVPSSPVILPNDPTILFANAGMNQFKPIFLGTVDPNTDLAKLKRVVNSQKCIRAGGKHNDLKDVGLDSYHHTFFEMLGTWSFGDYFKTEAIAWAWEILTKVYKLDETRLYATYFKGDESLGLEPDEEARTEWLKYLPAERILAAGVKENFWEMGATGPCGPCSEIHYDKVGGGYGLERVNQDDPLVIEIWNLVFIQYVREEEGGSLKKLPAKHIDTGMGLERLSSILCQVPTNYDIDIFQNLFEHIQRVTGCKTPYSGKYGADDVEGIDTAYRIVADHIRTITIAISDGGMPSNVGSGYVLRRIIRRAVRYGWERLGEKKGFFSQLAPVVVELLGGVYPALKNDPERVVSVISKEELAFSRTLATGLRRFKKLISGQPSGWVIPGVETARLYHTYGFPWDLTKRMALEAGVKVDKVAHKEAMANNAGVEQQDKKKMELLPLHGGAVKELQDADVKPTNDIFKYNPSPIQAKLVAIWAGRIKGFYDFLDNDFTNEEADPENPHHHVGLVFDQTNFYPEQGGQVFDTGRIFSDGFSLEVASVQVYGGYVVHYGTPKGELQLQSTLNLEVDIARRVPIANNHTSTHLCNFSLRKALGDHVDQQGSVVLDSKFRFDFSHDKPLKAEELTQIDQVVRDTISQNLVVYAADVPLSVATNIKGVRQMFGEKYPDPVRVVSVGVSVEDLIADPLNDNWNNYAIEFCGGTHVKHLSEILSFVTLSEESVSAGVRRVVCVTGATALNALENASEFERRLAVLDQVKGDALSSAVGALLKDLDAQANFPYAAKLHFRHVLGEAKKKAIAQVKEQEKDFKNRATELTNAAIAQYNSDHPRFVVLSGELGTNCGLVKTTIKNIQKKASVPVLIISTSGDALAVVGVTDKPNEGALPANAWVNSVLSIVNGKGGGKADSAQGTGTVSSSEQVSELVNAANAFAASKF